MKIKDNCVAQIIEEIYGGMVEWVGQPDKKTTSGITAEQIYLEEMDRE